MNGAYQAVIDSPIGLLGISLQDGRVSQIEFLFGNRDVEVFADASSRQVMAQLEAYFSGGSRTFSIPLQPEGTDFQKKVWSRLSRIPCGETRTYGEIARELGTSPRAVGNACRSNPIPLVVPCHRVVSAQGIGGFSGATEGEKLDVKKWLLAHEDVVL